MPSESTPDLAAVPECPRSRGLVGSRRLRRPGLRPGDERSELRQAGARASSCSPNRLPTSRLSRRARARAGSLVCKARGAWGPDPDTSAASGASPEPERARAVRGSARLRCASGLPELARARGSRSSLRGESACPSGAASRITSGRSMDGAASGAIQRALASEGAPCAPNAKRGSGAPIRRSELRRAGARASSCSPWRLPTLRQSPSARARVKDGSHRRVQVCRSFSRAAGPLWTAPAMPALCGSEELWGPGAPAWPARSKAPVDDRGERPLARYSAPTSLDIRPRRCWARTPQKYSEGVKRLAW